MEVEATIDKIEKLSAELQKVLSEERTKESDVKALDIVVEQIDQTKRMRRLFDGFARDRLRIQSTFLEALIDTSRHRTSRGASLFDHSKLTRMLEH